MRFAVLFLILISVTAHADIRRPKMSNREGVQETATGVISAAAKESQLSDAETECEAREDEEFFSSFCEQAKACQAQVLPIVHGLNTGHDFIFNRIGGLVASGIDAIVGGARNVKTAAAKVKIISAAANRLNKTNEKVMAVVQKGQAKADTVKSHYGNLRSHYDKLKADLQAAGDTVKIGEINQLISQVNQHEQKVLNMINAPINTVRETVTHYRKEAEALVGTITDTIDRATLQSTDFVKEKTITSAASHRSNLDLRLSLNLKFYAFHKLLQGDFIQTLTDATRRVKATVEHTCSGEQYQALLDQIGLTSSKLTAGGILIYQTHDSLVGRIATNNPLLSATTACKQAHVDGITALRIAALYAKRCYEKLEPEERRHFEPLTRENELVDHVESTRGSGRS